MSPLQQQQLIYQCLSSFSVFKKMLVFGFSLRNNSLPYLHEVELPVAEVIEVVDAVVHGKEGVDDSDNHVHAVVMLHVLLLFQVTLSCTRGRRTWRSLGRQLPL